MPEYPRCEWQVDPIGIDATQPHFSWTLKAVDPKERSLRQTAYQLIVTAAGKAAPAWNSGKVISPEMFQIEYAGSRLEPGTRYSWKLRVWDESDHASEWSNEAIFITGQLQPSNWKAQWIAAEPDRPRQGQALENRGEVRKSMPRLPIFRRDFNVGKQVQQALIFVSGLGHYELHINGSNVGDRLLAPGWTDYRKRVFYNTYDVTERIKSGNNAIGVMLGSGMYDVPGIEGRYTKFIGSFGQPKLILELHLRYSDGTEKVILSDRSWKTVAGPITFSTVFGGEDYDARLEQPGWDQPGFRESGWKDALEVSSPGGELTAELSPPIRVTRTYEPVKTTKPTPEVTVYDLGQNFSGWPEISVRGKRGSTVKIVAGELLDSSGRVSQHSIEASPQKEQRYVYTLRGEGQETWRPRFSHWGFRYVQVDATPAEGSREIPDIVSLRGQFMHDDVPAVGRFETSNELFGRIHKLIDMAVLSNMFSVLTDCPHREKLGWLEQTHLAGSSILLNHDGIQLYQKMAQDTRDSQLTNGMVPAIAPEYVAFVNSAGVNTAFRDSPEWGSASILSPWTAYEFYGDKDLLAQQYGSMRSYAAYLHGKAKDNILSYGLGDWYDIGPGAPGESQLTSKAVTATAIYYADLVALSKIATVLGHGDDAAGYQREALAVKDAFNALLFHPDTGQYDRGSQTANAMPLALGMVPPGHEAAVLNNLVDDIRKHGNHVTAGDIGFHFVVRALTDYGRSDVLYDMLSRTDSPSYGYQLERGATSLTEAWDTNPDNSQNHFMLGHGQEWLVRGLAGISFDLSRPRDEVIQIHPNLVGDIQNASASYRSVLGEVSSAWQREGGKVTLRITVPAGSVAWVVIPTSAAETVKEGNTGVGQASGVTRCEATTGGMRCQVASGTYEFSADH